MTKNIRSLSGAALMLMIIPIFVGILACMPVPIGDPERSRIDPSLSGTWVMEEDGDSNLYLFQPYDKRTGLVVGAQIEEGSEAEIDDLDIKTAGDVFAALRTYSIGDDGITSPTTIAFKAWLTKLGGEQFMTWEPVGGMNNDGSFKPDYWFVKENEDRVNLYVVNPEYEGFDGVTTPDDYDGDDYVGDMRRTWERALKRHAKDPELFGDEPWVMHRVPASDVEKVAELFQEVIEFD